MPNRNIRELLPRTQKKLKLALSKIGNIVFVVEGYRPQARQNYLYSLGRKIAGKIVTRTTKSNHTGRKAIDVGFRGKTLYPALSDPKRKRVASVFKRCGFNWGGDWKKVKDYPHFEDNGKALFINTLMLFYEKLWNDNYKVIPKDDRIFKDPGAAADRLNELPIDEATREGMFLLACLAEKLGLNNKKEDG